MLLGLSDKRILKGETSVSREILNNQNYNALLINRKSCSYIDSRDGLLTTHCNE